jgi:hypothetical protein
VAVSITVVNRFIDYWLHIGSGVVVWGVRRKLGLRSWREVPLDEGAPLATAAAEALGPPVSAVGPAPVAGVASDVERNSNP